jgi:hypothetical protein
VHGDDYRCRQGALGRATGRVLRESTGVVSSLSDKEKRGEKGREGGTMHWRRGGKGEGEGAGSVAPREGKWGLARLVGGVWPTRPGRGGHGVSG